MEASGGGNRISRRELLRRGAWGCAALGGAALFDATMIEPNWLQFQQIDIPIRGLGSEFDGYRISLLADTHYPRRISPDVIRTAVDMANSFSPDLFAIAGDFTDHKGSSTVPSLGHVFERVQARDGVVGVLGNHDHWLDGPGVKRELMDHTPIRVLENESFVLSRANSALAIGGTDDFWMGVVDPSKAFRDVPPEVPRIMLQHNPDLAEDMDVEVRVDLQLSGHTHGGEVRLPFGPAPFVPSKYGQKFRAGLCQGRSHRVYVTRGICTIHFARFMCPPEVTGITLRCA